MTAPTSAQRFLADARAAMELAGVWQYELAQRVGVSPKHMSEVFTGKVRLTFAMADRIAAALSLRVDARLRLARDMDGR